MFTPAIAFGGYAGFKVFERSLDRQFDFFAKTPEFQREIAYFKEAAQDIRNVTDFVADRRLLSVALSAFGLETELSKRALIRRVLEEPQADPKSFVNRLNDPRWRAFAQAFSFHRGPPPFTSAEFRATITSRHAERAFERAVGEIDGDVRLALNFRREINVVAASPNADRTGWFQILAQQPLRRVVETAFGLPQSLARLDVDRQREILEEKAERLLGSRSPSQFLDPEKVETVLRRFFLSQSSRQAPPSTVPGSAALAVLADLQADSAAGLNSSI